MKTEAETVLAAAMHAALDKILDGSFTSDDLAKLKAAVNPTRSSLTPGTKYIDEMKRAGFHSVYEGGITWFPPEQ